MDEDGSEETNESGGSLRTKLETALTDNAAMAQQLGHYKAVDIISAKGYKNVTPEDLANVKLGEMEAKAAELEEANGVRQAAAVRAVLSQKGLSGDQLDAAVADLMGPPTNDNGAALDRIRALGKVTGSAPSKDDDHGNTVFGPSRIKKAFGAT